MAKYTAEDLDKMAGYEVPEPRQKPTTVAEFETQQEAAQLVKDFMKLGVSGAGHGLVEEAIAGVKTGSLSSPEYVKERDLLRGDIQQARENLGLMAPFVEGAGAELATAALPIAKGAKIAKRIGSAFLQGAGEAPEVENIPKYSAVSGLAETGMELAGAGVKKFLFDDPTEILSNTIGTKGTEIRIKERFGAGKPMPGKYETVQKSLGGIREEDGQRAVLGSIERLDKKGFFKQGKKYFDPDKKAFVRTKDSLEGFLKPQNLDDLYETASQGLASLKSANEKLLKGKSIPTQEFKRNLDSAVASMTYDPYGFNLSKMGDLASEIAGIVESDMRMKKAWTSNTGNIAAKDVEIAKQSLDKYLDSPAFKKRAEELNITDSTIMSFRTKLDRLLDSVAGNEYKLNNDTMSDLKRVQDLIWEKQGRKYVDTGSRLVDRRGIGEMVIDTLNYPAANILRSDISKAIQTPASEFGMGVLKRVPSEMFSKDKGYYPERQIQQSEEEQVPQYNVVPKNFSGVLRNPSSIGFSPREIINYQIPRTTQGIIENKDRVLAKLVQNGVPDQMVDTIAQALNGHPEDLGNIASLLSTQFPTLFERSKYKTFDGKFVDPNDKARAADEISKRDDLNSIQRAKMINKINKTGEVPEGM